MKRQSREHRHRNVSVKLTERDAFVLEAMARFRLARTRDLIAAAFPGVHPTTAKLRLRRLFDGQFLDVRADGRNEENVYLLGIAGRRWASDNGIPLNGVPRGGHEHHLAIVRTWSGIAEAVGRLPGLHVEAAHPDWELRERLGGRSDALVPDLFVVLGDGDGEAGDAIALAVEVDLGTEALPVLRRKVHAYAEAASRQGGLFGWPGFGVAIVLRNAGRVAAVTRMLEEDFGGWWLVWTEEEGPASHLRRLAEALVGRARTTATGSRHGSSRTEGGSRSTSADTSARSTVSRSDEEVLQ